MKILRVLQQRDFALLWMGLTVSLVGDGIYMVAIAWQAFNLTDSPSGLALVGLAWSASVALSAFAGGIVSDRIERRRVMISADLLRAAALGVIAALSISHTLELWELVALVAVFAAGDGFFAPAMNGMIPELVGPEDLLDSSAIEQIVRQGMRRLIGPAIGGGVVASVGAGTAFAVDSGTFLVSAVAIFFIRARSRPRGGTATGLVDDARAGLGYVRSQRWLWVTVVEQGLALLLYLGPLQVLLPFIIRHKILGDSEDFGLVLAADGVGSVIAGLVMSRRGMPRRYMTALYLAWGLGTLPLVGMGLATSLAPLLIASFLHGALITVGIVIWATLQRSRVPDEMRGRVGSLDWVVGLALVPVSFALTAPLASVLGAGTTLIVAGLATTLLNAILFFGYRLWQDEPPLVALAEPHAQPRAGVA